MVIDVVAADVAAVVAVVNAAPVAASFPFDGFLALSLAPFPTHETFLFPFPFPFLSPSPSPSPFLFPFQLRPPFSSPAP